MRWRYTYYENILSFYSYPSYRIIHTIAINHYLFLIKVNLRCRLKILKQKLEDNIIDIKEKKIIFWNFIKDIKNIKDIKEKKIIFWNFIMFLIYFFRNIVFNNWYYSDIWNYQYFIKN